MRGNAKKELKDFKGAIMDYETVKILNPNDESIELVIQPLKYQISKEDVGENL